MKKANQSGIFLIVVFIFLFLFGNVFRLSAEWLILFMVILTVGVCGFGLHQDQSRSKSYQYAIHQELKQLGCHTIQISELRGERDKNSRTYFVRFIGPSGKRFQTKCIIRPNDSELYWRQSPLELLRGSGQGTITVDMLDYLQQIYSIDNGDDSRQRSQKEILLDKLNSTFRHERIEAIAEIAEMSQVDELIIHRLQEMAASDFDPQVEKAANKALATLGRESF